MEFRRTSLDLFRFHFIEQGSAREGNNIVRHGMSETPIRSPASNALFIDNNDLDSKQAAMKGQIAQQQYQSLSNILLSVPSRWIQRRKHRVTPLPFWYQAITLVIFSLSVTLILEILLGNPTQMTSIGVARGWIELLGVSISSVAVIVGARTHGILLQTLRETVINSISREADLTHFNQWLQKILRLRRQVMSALPIGILLTVVSLVLMFSLGISIDIASVVIMILYAAQIVSLVPAVNNFFSVPDQLIHYHLRLYSVDPSSSKVIVSLSRSMGSILLLLGAIASVSTLLSFFLGLLNTLLLILAFAIPWVVSISLFTVGHYALAKIIFQAKQQRLEEIQTKIEQIETEQDIANKETMESINRLADYYNRIKATRNSAIDVSVILRFLQSLLLPLIASLLGSIGQIIQFLSP